MVGSAVEIADAKSAHAAQGAVVRWLPGGVESSAIDTHAFFDSAVFGDRASDERRSVGHTALVSVPKADVSVVAAHRDVVELPGDVVGRPDDAVVAATVVSVVKGREGGGAWVVRVSA